MSPMRREACRAGAAALRQQIGRLETVLEILALVAGDEPLRKMSALIQHRREQAQILTELGNERS